MVFFFLVNYFNFRALRAWHLAKLQALRISSNSKNVIVIRRKTRSSDWKWVIETCDELHAGNSLRVNLLFFCVLVLRPVARIDLQGSLLAALVFVLAGQFKFSAQWLVLMELVKVISILFLSVHRRVLILLFLFLVQIIILQGLGVVMSLKGRLRGVALFGDSRPRVRLRLDLLDLV